MFQDQEEYTVDDIKQAMERNDPKELSLVSVTLALTCEDRSLIETICVQLCTHPNNMVRANALTSLGHLARRFRNLEEKSVKPAIEAGLRESDDSVRENAKSAADEIYQFLGWTIENHVFG